MVAEFAGSIGEGSDFDFVVEGTDVVAEGSDFFAQGSDFVAIGANCFDLLAKHSDLGATAELEA